MQSTTETHQRPHSPGSLRRSAVASFYAENGEHSEEVSGRRETSDLTDFYAYGMDRDRERPPRGERDRERERRRGGGDLKVDRSGQFVPIGAQEKLEAESEGARQAEPRAFEQSGAGLPMASDALRS